MKKKMSSIWEDELCCLQQPLINRSDEAPTSCRTQCNLFFSKYHQFVSKTRKLRSISAHEPSQTRILSIGCVIITLVALVPVTCLSSNNDYQQQQQQQQHIGTSPQVAQARVGGLEAGDYIDEAGELEVMANQQQIPTAQLMAAAGHIVPENFFLPGGSIPALYSRYQHQQQQQQQQQVGETLHQVASHLQASRMLVPNNKYIRQMDLLAAATAAAEQQESSQLVDYNGYNLVMPQETNNRDSANAQAQGQDLTDYMNQPSQQQQQQLYEQQQHYAEQQIAAELAALREQQQQQMNMDQSVQSSENSPVVGSEQSQYAAGMASSTNIGPAYLISGQDMSQMSYGGGAYERDIPQRPYGLPNKSSSKEPSGMLKPLGNPKTISSPVIDFVTNQLPKQTPGEKLAEKLPHSSQVQTVFSFSSSKDPSEKVKGVNQKKRNVMRQAEQLARMMIKSVNDKFGTTIGDQTDLPFLLSSLGPLGLAQNLLFDPTLLVTLLNSAEKTYLSEVLPGPAKAAIRPVLNIFRMPNKKKDKANLSNIISYIASGGQTQSTPVKHRQGYGVEKASKNKNR